jgi:LysM repeat protein
MLIAAVVHRLSTAVFVSSTERSPLEQFAALVPVLAPAVFCAAIALVLTIATSGRGEAFTEFYVLSSGGRTNVYPEAVALGDEASVIVGIANHEGRQTSYVVELRLGGSVVDRVGPIRLSDGASREMPVNLRLNLPGDRQRLDFVLQKDGSSVRYRSLQLFVDVKLPGDLAGAPRGDVASVSATATATPPATATPRPTATATAATPTSTPAVTATPLGTQGPPDATATALAADQPTVQPTPDGTPSVTATAAVTATPTPLAATPIIVTGQGAYHIARPGDTLASIAARYGLPVSVVAQANGIAQTANVEPSQGIRIPAVLYTATTGDTISDVAARYGVSEASLIAANTFTSPDVITPGQVVVVPRVAP